ncbi:MAG: helix-turn-helix transcriptional regulator, partial [Chitinophaga rupis]
ELYLGGTMTAYGVVKSVAGGILTGIRFRPGGFYALYRMPMEAAVDRVLAFPEPELKSLMEKEEGLAARLDAYFGAKRINSRHGFAPIYKTVYLSRGQITVEELAESCHVSKRTLERIFKENVGIPPKEFIRVVRFQEVLTRLRQAGSRSTSEESLLRVAFELGYYDHAHLTNEFSKYAGILPSELSRFYKTGISNGNYF